MCRAVARVLLTSGLFARNGVVLRPDLHNVRIPDTSGIMTECTICHQQTDRAACDRCLIKLYDDLRDITLEYRRLDPNPTGAADSSSRRSPGFRSQSPANDHVIALRDRRTRAKVAGDLQNAHTFMADWVVYVQHERNMAARSPLSIEAAYYALHAHEDWISRQEWVADLASQARSVLGQLKAANGDQPPTRIGTCSECEAGALVLIGGWVECRSCVFRVSAADVLAQHYQQAA